jgi:pSer/pThr/pTyr-binding forkhead associated (FHA) protein
MKQGQPPRQTPPPKRAVTVLEPIEELREQLRRMQTTKEALPPTVPMPPANALAPSMTVDDETLVFRPTHRPTMAVLYVSDDGDESGETIRIRASEFVIGRTEGDLVIPHDGAISGRHAEISRRFEKGQYQWFLRDLLSSNGTFVRVSNALLNPNQEILLGSLRYRFELPTQGAATAAGAGIASTRKWHLDEPPFDIEAGRPALVEMTPHGDGRRFPLIDAEYTIGRDHRLVSIVLDDKMVSPRHARIHRDPKGRWHIENAKSLNGLWLRIEEIALDRGGHFQCGEQRFLIRIP